jgi:FixJ family two-component response regulator
MVTAGRASSRAYADGTIREQGTRWAPASDDLTWIGERPDVEHARMAGRGEDLVAIIDDDAAVLDSLRFLLEVAGLRVATYRSAAAFLADADAHPSCLILDHHMPDMTGLELVERLRADGAQLRVMLITGLNSPGLRGQAAALGVVKVLEKPPAEQELLEFVTAAA